MISIGKLEYVEVGDNIEEHYPELANAQKRQFLLQTEDEIFTLFVQINYVSERLYFKIENDELRDIVIFNTLVENVNLVGGIIEGYALEFRNNEFFFGEV